jgi:hypothetical protein
MTIRLLAIILVSGLLSWGPTHLASAQNGTRRGQSYWYTVQNDVLVLKTGATYKVLKENVTLPNGSQLEARSRYVIRPTGERVQLNQDDMVTPSGDIIRVKAPSATVAAGTGEANPPAAAAPAASQPASDASITYVPTAPVNGKLKGVVELGASGFNSFIVRVDPQRNWKLEKAEFGNSLVLENMATEDDIQQGLKAYISKMLDYGVGGRDIHFVVSSGAATAPITQRITQRLKSLNYVVHVVTPEQEGALGLRAALPPTFADKAFVVDMGSANTKVAWLSQGKTVVTSTYGSKFFQQNVSEATVTADVAAKAAAVPTGLRQTCFILGGIPFELAKISRQGKQPYTVLRAPSAYAHVEGAKTKAGLTIYQALAEATGCQQFVFGWDANFSIGYLLQTP